MRLGEGEGRWQARHPRQARPQLSRTRSHPLVASMAPTRPTQKEPHENLKLRRLDLKTVPVLGIAQPPFNKLDSSSGKRASQVHQPAGLAQPFAVLALVRAQPG